MADLQQAVNRVLAGTPDLSHWIPLQRRDADVEMWLRNPGVLDPIRRELQAFGGLSFPTEPDGDDDPTIQVDGVAGWSTEELAWRAEQRLLAAVDSISLFAGESLQRPDVRRLRILTSSGTVECFSQHRRSRPPLARQRDITGQVAQVGVRAGEPDELSIRIRAAIESYGAAERSIEGLVAFIGYWSVLELLVPTKDERPLRVGTPYEGCVYGTQTSSAERLHYLECASLLYERSLKQASRDCTSEARCLFFRDMQDILEIRNRVAVHRGEAPEVHPTVLWEALEVLRPLVRVLILNSHWLRERLGSDAWESIWDPSTF